MNPTNGPQCTTARLTSLACNPAVQKSFCLRQNSACALSTRRSVHRAKCQYSIAHVRSSLVLHHRRCVANKESTTPQLRQAIDVARRGYGVVAFEAQAMSSPPTFMVDDGDRLHVSQARSVVGFFLRSVEARRGACTYRYRLDRTGTST